MLAPTFAGATISCRTCANWKVAYQLSSDIVFHIHSTPCQWRPCIPYLAFIAHVPICLIERHFIEGPRYLTKCHEFQIAINIVLDTGSSDSAYLFVYGSHQLRLAFLLLGWLPSYLTGNSGDRGRIHHDTKPLVGQFTPTTP